MVRYCISKDGMMIYINEEDFKADDFTKKGYIIKRNKLIFPSRDRYAGEKYIEYPYGWAINPSAFLHVYPHETDVFRDFEKIKNRMCRYDRRGNVLRL